MRRRTHALLAMAALCCLQMACGDIRNLRSDEAEIVAWWIEDVAHGVPRRPEELRLVDSSERMRHIADWADGDQIRGEHQPPHLLLARRSRHALLANLLAHGQVVITSAGLLAPRPGLELNESEAVDPLVDAENRDRRQLDAILLTLADAHEGVARDYLAAVTRARLESDRHEGGRMWEQGK